MRRVLLINPGWGGLVSRGGRRFNRAWPPLSLLNAAAMFEQAGHEVSLIDGRARSVSLTTWQRAAAEADLVLITSSPLDRWQCPNLEVADFHKLVRALNHPQVFITGAHGTIYPEKTLTATAAAGVIRGEPEAAVRALAEGANPDAVPGLTYARDGQVIHNPVGPDLDLADLPLPAYHLIDPKDYYYEVLGPRLAILEGSRGCPFNCRFCLKIMYGRSLRVKPPAQLAAEIDHVIGCLGFRSIYFMDLEFTLNRDNVIAICNHIIQAGHRFVWTCQTRADSVDADLLALMKRAGCRLIHFGVETGSPQVMELIRKNISLDQIIRGVSLTKAAGIDAACFFLFGFPGETDADMRQTIKFAIQLNPTYASFHAATPYPGTPFHHTVGHLYPEDFPECFYQEHDPDQLERMTTLAYRRFYFRPEYLISLLAPRRIPALWRQAKLFLSFIS
ncbi:MAG: radical SAM protein [Deltaproteobacteria bacterium]|nr:radical SAM protein [Deltaproteobacteria bacterium]